MSHEKIIADKLSETLQDLGGKLEALRESLQALRDAVPVVPDADRLAASVAAAIPEPEPLPAPIPAPSAPAGSPLNNGLLYRVATMEFAETQVDILKHLMEAVQEFASRGVLYILKADQAQSWSGFGFAGGVKGWHADLSSDPLLKTLVAGRNRMLLDGTLPGFVPVKGSVRRSLITPLLLKGKPAAFLYADSDADGKLDHYSIDLLMRTASLVIDILPLRPKREPLSPVLENQDIILPGPAPRPAVPAEETPLFEDSGTLAATEVTAGQTAVAEIPMPEAPPPPPAKAAEEPVPPGEEKAHEDAKRFARLLVQEIALYHPKEVEEGRARNKLYALLREDIDRSRDAYDQRFSSKPSIRAREYFTAALVKHLADGDAAALGL